MQFIKTALSIVLIFCGILVTILVVPRSMTYSSAEQILPDSLWQLAPDFDTAVDSKSAPVRIVEYLDYECPFCHQYWTQYVQNTLNMWP